MIKWVYMKITNGKHRILFSKGKLYLDGIQIAGEGILPEKNVAFEFQVNKPEESPETSQKVEKDPSVLEINVHESMALQSIGPGQR